MSIAGEDGQPWVDAANGLAEETGVPIRAFTLSLDEGDYIDLRGAWARMRRMDRGGVVVVRPDRYVGFHWPSAVADPVKSLAAAFAALARPIDI